MVPVSRRNNYSLVSHPPWCPTRCRRAEDHVFLLVQWDNRICSSRRGWRDAGGDHAGDLLTSNLSPVAATCALASRRDLVGLHRSRSTGVATSVCHDGGLCRRLAGPDRCLRTASGGLGVLLRQHQMKSTRLRSKEHGDVPDLAVRGESLYRLKKHLL